MLKAQSSSSISSSAIGAWPSVIIFVFFAQQVCFCPPVVFPFRMLNPLHEYILACVLRARNSLIDLRQDLLAFVAFSFSLCIFISFRSKLKLEFPLQNNPQQMPKDFSPPPRVLFRKILGSPVYIRPSHAPEPERPTRGL